MLRQVPSRTVLSDGASLMSAHLQRRLRIPVCFSRGDSALRLFLTFFDKSLSSLRDIREEVSSFSTMSDISDPEIDDALLF